MTNISKLTSSAEGSWRLYSQLQASRREEQYRNLTTWWLRKILDCDLYVSLYRLNSDVCKKTASLLTLVNTYNPYQNYCEEPRGPKTPKFPSFLVSRIVCLGYSTLHFIDWTLTERNPLRHLYDQRTVLRWTTRPSANKGPGLLCSARRGLGRGHKKRRNYRWDFSKLLNFNEADVLWYFFFQEGASWQETTAINYNIA